MMRIGLEMQQHSNVLIVVRFISLVAQESITGKENVRSAANQKVGAIFRAHQLAEEQVSNGERLLGNMREQHAI